MNEILILFEKTKIITQNKKKKIDKLYEKSRKNVIINIIILKEIENKNKISKNNNNNKKELKL